ncbi:MULTISPECIES: hypothetical protein [Actinoalloteichus]|uniref:Uncharacterized protein n=1 Tax=Actinoalloteichus fjordicus TaxID=1612552 RepID=A0AAC9LFL6_9PSEU|nr:MULTISPECIES: hypothetical protein [Actinoalloteichus]APU15872.1 hypothetical protein UA74_19235 [Actinoalloteichus fjordicus]APU21934.1 hypothetical protein UA75_19725 [Actinoalloteichus sp. GBA129-24]
MIDPWEAEAAGSASTAEVSASTRGGGVAFRERMATRRGDRPRMVVTLKADIPGIDPFLADAAHPVSMRGVVSVEGIVSRARVSGTLSLFAEGEREAMSYAMHFVDDDGRRWQLSGVKTVRSRNPLELLIGLTTLRAELSLADAAAGPKETQRFVLSIGARDLVRLGASLRGSGPTSARRLRAVARFGSFFTAATLRRR